MCVYIYIHIYICCVDRVLSFIRASNVSPSFSHGINRFTQNINESVTASCLYKTVLLTLDFAICDRQAFRNEVLGLRKYMGELNFTMTSCFTKKKGFWLNKLRKQNNNNKKYVFHRETEGEGERNHLLLKKQKRHPRQIIFWF